MSDDLILVRRGDNQIIRLLNELDQQTERANKAEDLVASYRNRFTLLWKEDWFKEHYPKFVKNIK